MIKKVTPKGEYIFRQEVPANAVGLPIDSLESELAARRSLIRFGIDAKLTDEVMSWIKNLSGESLGDRSVHGQLRLETSLGSKLAVLLFVELTCDDDSWERAANAQELDDSGDESIEQISSPIDGSMSPIYSKMQLNPKDRIIYDTRTYILRDIPGGACARYTAQTSALSMRSNLTKIFKDWVQSSQWEFPTSGTAR